MNTTINTNEIASQFNEIFNFFNIPEVLLQISQSQGIQDLYERIENELRDKLSINTYEEFEQLLEEYVRSGIFIGDSIDLESTVNAAAYTTGAKIQRT